MKPSCSSLEEQRAAKPPCQAGQEDKIFYSVFAADAAKNKKLH
jgi:hypothetical protein